MHSRSISKNNEASTSRGDISLIPRSTNVSSTDISRNSTGRKPVCRAKSVSYPIGSQSSQQTTSLNTSLTSTIKSGKQIATSSKKSTHDTASSREMKQPKTVAEKSKPKTPMTKGKTGLLSRFNSEKRKKTATTSNATKNDSSFKTPQKQQQQQRKQEPHQQNQREQQGKQQKQPQQQQQRGHPVQQQGQPIMQLQIQPQQPIEPDEWKKILEKYHRKLLDECYEQVPNVTISTDMMRRLDENISKKNEPSASSGAATTPEPQSTTTGTTTPISDMNVGHLAAPSPLTPGKKTTVLKKLRNAISSAHLNKPKRKSNGKSPKSNKSKNGSSNGGKGKDSKKAIPQTVTAPSSPGDSETNANDKSAVQVLDFVSKPSTSTMCNTMEDNAINKIENYDNNVNTETEQTDSDLGVKILSDSSGNKLESEVDAIEMFEKEMLAMTESEPTHMDTVPFWYSNLIRTIDETKSSSTPIPLPISSPTGTEHKDDDLDSIITTQLIGKSPKEVTEQQNELLETIPQASKHSAIESLVEEEVKDLVVSADREIVNNNNENLLKGIEQILQKFTAAVQENFSKTLEIATRSIKAEIKDYLHSMQPDIDIAEINAANNASFESYDSHAIYSLEITQHVA